MTGYQNSLGYAPSAREEQTTVCKDMATDECFDHCAYCCNVTMRRSVKGHTAHRYGGELNSLQMLELLG